MNKIEEAAVKYVIDYENKKGKKCWRISRKKKTGCDLRTQDGKYIEVKGWSKPQPPNKTYIYDSIFKHLKNNKSKDRAYYIYVVYSIPSNPKLLILTPKNLKRNISEPVIRIVNINRASKNVKPIFLKPRESL